MCPRPGYLLRTSNSLHPLRNGSIVVDYLVLLELPFSSQLESEYEQVKHALKKELQNVSQDQDSCQNSQCEW